MSQEELAEKLFISRQAVSKWESGQSVPDIDNIVRLSEIFGVSCDYLLKCEDTVRANDHDGGAPHRRTVNRHEAEAYMETSRKSAYTVGLGVLLCIIAVIPLLLISTAIDGGILQMKESVGLALSLAVLLTLVAVAVALFIYVGIKFSAFSYLEEDFVLDGEYRESLIEQSGKITKRFSVGVIVGVCAIILAVIPFIALAIIQISDFVTVVALCAMMLTVGFAVGLIIIVGLPKGACDRLLCIGEYSTEKKSASKALEAFSSAYWSLTLIVYLGYSFLASSWSISWIIWPIAGVLYGIIEALFSLKRNR